jgi:hypothetical protein
MRHGSASQGLCSSLSGCQHEICHRGVTGNGFGAAKVGLTASGAAVRMMHEFCLFSVPALKVTACRGLQGFLGRVETISLPANRGSLNDLVTISSASSRGRRVKAVSEIHLTATAGPDGVLHLDVPVGASGEFEVVVRPKVNGAGRKPTPEELGWPPGYFEQTYGSITDENFVAPPRVSVKPVPPLDAGE